MLAGHSALFCPPELNLLPFETMVDRRARLGACRMERYRELGLHPEQGLQRALMELQGLDAAASERMIQRWIDSNQSIASVYSMLSEFATPRWLVDKSAFYAAAISTLRNAEKLFNAPLYIYLFRHPYAVIESLVRNRFRPGPNRDLLGAGEALWTDTNANILGFLAAVGQERQIRIGYEELVCEPARVVTRLCSFLGIGFEEAILHPYEGKRMTDGIRPGLPALGDIGFDRHLSIDSRLGSRWTRIRIPVPLTRALPIAEALGYELPLGTAATEVVPR
jgi:hypothetical protein